MRAPGAATLWGTFSHFISPYAREELKYTWIRIGMAIRTMWKKRVVMLSAWKAKMQISVASSARMLTGWRTETNRSNHACPLVRIRIPLETTPAESGMTMKKMTEYSRTMNGTVREDAPRTRSVTIGANRTSMIRSLTDTCTRVYAGSPSVRWLHTKTMAVQGAAARMMTPAMYWSASAGVIQAEKMWRKKTHPISAMENGFTSQ